MHYTESALVKTLTLTNYGVSIILTLYQCDWYHPAPLKKLLYWLTSIANRNLSQNKSVINTCNKMEESKKNQSGTLIQCINRPLL